MNFHRNHAAATLTSMIVICGITATVAALQPAPSNATKQADLPMPRAIPLPPATPAASAPQPPQHDSTDIPLDEPIAPGTTSVRLSAYEREVLARGPISSARYIGGDLIGTLLGFGLGHAVQGRYSDVGVIFTAAEAASLGLLVGGVLNGVAASQCIQNANRRGGAGSGVTACENEIRNESMWNGLLLSGAIMFSVFRVWEMIDLSVVPVRQNTEYRRVRRKAERAGWKNFSMAPIILPNGSKFAMAGVRF